MITFSVVTICYNDLNGLKDTYDSLNAQMCRNFEWIIIDGGSTDGTKEFLANLNERCSAIVSEPDDGLYDAMNKGLSYCNGQFVIFMNSGDRFADGDVLTKVERHAIKNESVKFIYGDSYDTDGKSSKKYKAARSVRMLWYGMFARHQSMFYDLAQIKKLNLLYDGVSYTSAADYAFTASFLKTLDRKKNVYKLDFAVCTFLLFGFSLASAEKSRKEQVLIKRHILKMPEWQIGFVYMVHYSLFHMRNSLPKLFRKNNL